MNCSDLALNASSLVGGNSSPRKEEEGCRLATVPGRVHGGVMVANLPHSAAKGQSSWSAETPGMEPGRHEGDFGPVP